MVLFCITIFSTQQENSQAVLGILGIGQQISNSGISVSFLGGIYKDRKYPHALVAGLSRCPRKVTKKMGKKKI